LVVVSPSDFRADEFRIGGAVGRGWFVEGRRRAENASVDGGERSVERDCGDLWQTTSAVSVHCGRQRAGDAALMERVSFA